MLENGYIKLYRSLLSWEWYDSTETVRLFIHLLLTANYEPKQWRGITIERGQRACSIATLSKETSLSPRTVRTCIERLISTSELTKLSTPQYTVLSIKNYDVYQSETNKTTNDRQTTDKQNDKQNDKQTTNETTKQTSQKHTVMPTKKHGLYQSPTNETTSKTTSETPGERQLHKKERNKEVYIPPISPLDDISENAQKAFACFMEMRVKMKKPMTGEAVRLAVNKLKGMATDEATQIAIINQSIERCWLSFFPLKDEQKRTDKPAKSTRAQNHSTRKYTDAELGRMGRDLLEDV